MNELVLFIISILPVFLIGYYVYIKDKEKEPWKLLITLFVGGILSCFPALILELIIGGFFEDIVNLNLFQLLFYVFIGIALVEELCKWVIVYKFSYNSKYFDHIYDMIVYSVFVALGFAFLENLLYVYQSGVGTGIIRALLSVPGHACDGLLMGYFLGLSKISKINNRKDLFTKYLLLSIVVPIISHGLYDYFLFTNQITFIVLFFILVISVYVFSIKKVNRISKVSLKFKYNDNYCPICGQKVSGNYCTNCGRKNN